MKNIFFTVLTMFLVASSIAFSSLAGKDRNEDRQVEPDPRDSKKAKSEQDASEFFELLPCLEEGFDALHRAVARDDTLAVSPLLQGDLIPTEPTDLHITAGNGQVEVEALQMLLDNGFFDDHLTTPLEYAARFGQVEALRMLLADDRFLNGDFDKGCPMHEAVKNGHVEVLRILLADGRFIYDCETQGTPLDYAAAFGKIEALRILLDDGRFINDEYEWKASFVMMNAVIYGHAEVLQILLADDRFNAPDDDDTALHCAARYGNLEALRILLADGRFNNRLRERGETPLHDAAVFGHTNIVRALIWHFPRPEDLIGDNDRAILANGQRIRTDIAQMILNWERPVWNKAYLVIYPKLLRTALYNWFLVLNRLRIIYPSFKNALFAVPTHIVVDFYADQEGWNPYNLRNTERRSAEIPLIEDARALEEQDQNNGLEREMANPPTDGRGIPEALEEAQLMPAFTAASPAMMAAALTVIFAHGKQPPL